jgi:hypothetical protein
LIISLTFVLTTICYSFILKGIWPVFFFVLELSADVAAQTVLVYLTGGPKSNYFTVYIIYCAAGGLFYNYRVSAVIAVLIAFFYTGLLLATQWGWIQEFSYPFQETGFLSGLGTLQNAALLIVFLLVAIYGIWIASHFTKIREEALENKNRELVALNRISSLTRSVISLERVITEVIRAVREGMGYEAAFLLYQDTEAGKIRICVQEDTPYVREIKRLTRTDPQGLYLPMEDQTNLVYQAMRKKK